jgi:hypothetical protein
MSHFAGCLFGSQSSCCSLDVFWLAPTPDQAFGQVVLFHTKLVDSRAGLKTNTRYQLSSQLRNAGSRSHRKHGYGPARDRSFQTHHSRKVQYVTYIKRVATGTAQSARATLVPAGSAFGRRVAHALLPHLDGEVSGQA